MTECKNKDLTPFGVFLKVIQQAPSADNSQPWHCFWDGQSLFIVFDTKRAGGALFGVESQATLLAIGGVVENIKQAAESLNVSLSIDLTPTIYQEEHCYCRITFNGEEPLSADMDEVKLAILNRHTNRLKFKSSLIPKDVIEKISEASEQEAKAFAFDDKNEVKQIADLVFEASKVRFQTKALHEWLSGSLHFGDKGEVAGEGLDINTIDLPLGGQAFMRFIRPWKVMSFLNKFGVYQVMAKIDSMPISRAPAIVAVTAPETYQGSLEAGQLISRIWGYLNEQGIAVHPYYVVSDQLQRYKKGLVPAHMEKNVGHLVKEAETFFRLGDVKSLQILLRIGYPEKEPVFSKRLPLDVIFTDVSSD